MTISPTEETHTDAYRRYTLDLALKAVGKTCDWELGCGKGIKNAAIGLSGRLFRIDGHVSIDKGLYGQNVKSHTFWFAQHTLCKI